MLLFISCSNQTRNNLKDNDDPIVTSDSVIVGGGCDGCEIMYVGIPQKILPVDTSVAWKQNELGQKLLVHGTVYKLDGKTPAPNVILYYWHTNNDGYYLPSPSQDAKSKRHGHIRGWVKTDSLGHYAIYTIKPAPYPGRKFPAHIHMVLKEPNLNEYWVDEIEFDNDPLLTIGERKKYENRGGSGIVMLENAGTMQIAERNIYLGLHIPNYPQKNNSTYKSGLSIGENLPAFDPKHIAGPDKGKIKCPMCAYGFGQGILMFWNSNDLSKLWPLLKNLDAEIAKNGLTKIRVFAIYTNSTKETLQTVESRLIKESMINQINNCAVCYVASLTQNDYIKYFELNNSSEIQNTIFVYRKRKVIDKFINYNGTDTKQLTQLLY